MFYCRDYFRIFNWCFDWGVITLSLIPDIDPKKPCEDCEPEDMGEGEEDE